MRNLSAGNVMRLPDGVRAMSVILSLSKDGHEITLVGAPILRQAQDDTVAAQHDTVAAQHDAVAISRAVNF
jgi:hypothetical protein